MTVFSIFMSFILSTLGLGLLFHSQVYLKFSAFKKNISALEYSSENGAKQALDCFYGLLQGRESPPILTEIAYEELRNDAQGGGVAAAEMALGSSFPMTIKNSWGDQSWQSSIEIGMKTLQPGENRFAASYTVTMTAEGSYRQFRQKKKSVLEGELCILAGRVPLAAFPFLIEKALSSEEKALFPENSRISLLPLRGDLVQPRVQFAEAPLIPLNAGQLLALALKIDTFYPQDLSPVKLRSALGLEAANAPVPQGVYLIQNDLGLGGIYVQGDLEELVTAVEGTYQYVSFSMEQDQWTLKFSLPEGKTDFETPTGNSSYDLIPLGIIIVDGKIQSLGGGVVDSSGRARIVNDEEIPSIAQGVGLTIVSSDTVTISSHLLRQGMSWQEGIPYIKGQNSPLIIFPAGRNFFDGGETEGGIIISANAPQELKIQASLISPGRPVCLDGHGKTVHLIGSVQAHDYVASENALRLYFLRNDPGWQEAGSLSPETIQPVLLVASFKILGWKDYE
jgi:hypothetical protein